jgi:hypothetical protein
MLDKGKNESNQITFISLPINDLEKVIESTLRKVLLENKESESKIEFKDRLLTRDDLVAMGFSKGWQWARVQDGTLIALKQGNKVRYSEKQFLESFMTLSKNK